MDIGSELFSMAFALKLQRVAHPTAEASSLRLSDAADNNNFFLGSDNIKTSDVSLNDSMLPETPSEFEFFYRHTVTLTAVYCVAYVIVFLVGLIGNSFVIAVVLRSPKMRTTTNFFIVNLAMADILVIVFCLPATLMSNIFVPWMLGWLMCKIVPYIQGVSVAASVYSLCAVSVDSHVVHHSAPVAKLVATPVHIAHHEAHPVHYESHPVHHEAHSVHLVPVVKTVVPVVHTAPVSHHSSSASVVHHSSPVHHGSPIYHH